MRNSGTHGIDIADPIGDDLLLLMTIRVVSHGRGFFILQKSIIRV
jgi:hypothetical protein